MRGVVTLAAVFLLPAETPGRELLRLAAFAVVAGSLLIQGLSLPWLIRRLGLPAPDAAEDALQYAALITEAARAGQVRLNEVRSPDDPPEVIDQLLSRTNKRTNVAWERLGRPQAELEPPSAAYRRLRMQMLDAERTSLLEARDSGLVDDEVLRSALASVDLEESMLDRVEDAESRLDTELVAPPQPALRGAGRRRREDGPRRLRATTARGGVRAPAGCPARRGGPHARRLRGMPT